MTRSFATSGSEEVLVAPPTTISALTQVRGTLITASLKALGERSLLDRYYAALAPDDRARIRTIIAGSWVPEPLATAHYRACDTLGLATPEILVIGADVGKRIRETFLGPLLRVAREAGTTPWMYIERTPRLLARICVGGAVAAYKLGPKEARVEWYGLKGLEYAYFRTAFRGANQAIIELFCTKAYVSEVRAARGGDWAFRASWA